MKILSLFTLLITLLIPVFPARAAIASPVCVPVTCATPGVNNSPVLPLGRFSVWLYSLATAQTFYAQGPHPGVTSVFYAHAGDDPALVAEFHAQGVAVWEGIGGSLGCDTQDSWKKQTIDPIIAAGVDGVFVNEPWACPAPINGWPGSFTDPNNIAGLVTQYNRIADYWTAGRPGAAFGFCNAADQNWHILLLNAGLKETFACIEQYGVSHIHYFDALKAAYPHVQTVALDYGTGALCGFNSSPKPVTGTENETAYFDTWAAYDATNTLSVVPGPTADASWMQNFLTFAATGQRPFCTGPFIKISSLITWTTQTSDIVIQPLDIAIVTSANYKLASCEYRVESNGVETVPWTSRQCENYTSVPGTFKMAGSSFVVTVGAGKNCRDNGVYYSAASPLGIAPCQVFVRSTTTTGIVSDVMAVRFNISIPAGP